jgi:hypothetical protein
LTKKNICSKIDIKNEEGKLMKIMLPKELSQMFFCFEVEEQCYEIKLNNTELMFFYRILRIFYFKWRKQENKISIPLKYFMYYMNRKKINIKEIEKFLELFLNNKIVVNLLRINKNNKMQKISIFEHYKYDSKYKKIRLKFDKSIVSIYNNSNGFLMFDLNMIKKFAF